MDMNSLEKFETSQNWRNQDQLGNNGIKKTLETITRNILTAVVLILTPMSQLPSTTRETPSLPPVSSAWKIILERPEKGCWYRNNKQFCVASNLPVNQ